MSVEQLEFEDYDCIFIGENYVDERSILAKDFIENSFGETEIVRTQYDSATFTVKMNGVDVSLKQLRAKLEDYSLNKVLLEATSLDFSEILVLLKELSEVSGVIDFLYLTPEKYGRVHSPSLNRYNFKLSNGFKDPKPIPGFTPMLGSHGGNAKLVSFVGFESGRLGRVLSEDENASIKRMSVVFAVPPFVSGWENYSLFQHSYFLSEGISEEAQFVSAYSPFSTYSLLVNKIEPSLRDGEIIQLAPYGTKPTSIGVAVYAVQKFQEAKNSIEDHNYSQKNPVSVKYDFPEKANSRSEGIGSVYLYRLIA